LYTGTSGPGACQPSDVVLAEARAGKNNGCGGGNSSHAGNPCNPANGNKYQVEQDYRSVDGAIIIDRHYNSQLNRDTNFGVGWTSSVHKRLEISGSILVLRRSDGRSAPFVLNTRQWLGDTDSLLSFSQDNNGDSNYFTLIKPNGVREHYETARAGGTMDALDPNGRLVSETSSAGQITNYFYRTDGKLDRVTDPFGHTLTFGYNANGHVSTITDPANKIIS
jgi:YD repeat-containing protein